jgi:DNA-binding NtrC family response regulator
MDARAGRLPVPGSGAGVDVARGGLGAAALGQLASAFQEAAAGVEGTHRLLLERVEQLTRELERMRVAAEDPVLLACDGAMTLETLERRAVLATLERFGGHRDRTARALGIGVRTLGMKLRRWKDDGLVPEHV